MPILERYTKQPGERRFYDITFKKYLDKMGDAPRALNPIETFCDAGITMEESEVEWFPEAGFVRLWFSGGTHLMDYNAGARLHTLRGETLEGDIVVRVREYGRA